MNPTLGHEPSQLVNKNIDICRGESVPMYYHRVYCTVYDASSSGRIVPSPKPGGAGLGANGLYNLMLVVTENVVRP